MNVVTRIKRGFLVLICSKKRSTEKLAKELILSVSIVCRTDMPCENSLRARRTIYWWTKKLPNCAQKGTS